MGRVKRRECLGRREKREGGEGESRGDKRGERGRLGKEDEVRETG